MQFDLKIANLGPVVDLLAQMTGEQMRQAHAAALNDVAFQIRRDMQAEMASVFDRPTPFIARAPKIFAARPDKLSVAIVPTMHSEGTWSSGGKVGVDPQDVLQAQEWGGARRDKKSEVVLRRAGLLPQGYQTAIPATPYPGSDDGNGNIRGAFMQRLLSYLQAFGEQGYSANMGARKKRTFEGARNYANLRTRKRHVERDQRFFVVQPHRAGTAHLAPGIWAARGTHGSDLRPVLMFVRAGTYKPRLSMERIAERTDRAAYFERRLRYQIRRLMGV